jgi:hypothetical protein
MASTSIRSACDRLLSGIFASIKVLTYSSVPVTDYFRQKDIDLLKDQLAALSPVLIRLREKDDLFPTKPRIGLVLVLDECNALRKRSQKLLDREQGTFRLTAAANPRCTWECAKRDEAFLLRNQIMQHRCAFEAALAVANMVMLAASAKHVTAQQLDAELDEQVVATKEAAEAVLADTVRSPDGLLSRSKVVLRLRNDVIMPRDIGITTPSRELITLLDDLLGFAAGILETTEDCTVRQHVRGKKSLASLRSRSSKRS